MKVLPSYQRLLPSIAIVSILRGLPSLNLLAYYSALVGVPGGRKSSIKILSIFEIRFGVTLSRFEILHLLN